MIEENDDEGPLAVEVLMMVICSLQGKGPFVKFSNCQAELGTI